MAPRSARSGTPRVVVNIECRLYLPSGVVASLGSSVWNEWIASATNFYFDGRSGVFTARREKRPSGWYWWAYRKHENRLYKTYLGAGASLTLESLEAAASRLAVKAGI